MSKPYLKFDLGASDAVPEDLKMAMAGLIDGSIKSLIIIAEYQDGSFMDGYSVDINDGKSNTAAMIGAIEILKRDFMREEIKSRREYVGIDDVLKAKGDDESEAG